MSNTLPDLTLVACKTIRWGDGSDRGVYIALFEVDAPVTDLGGGSVLINTDNCGYVTYVYEWQGRQVIGETVKTNNKLLAWRDNSSPAEYDIFAVQQDTGIDPTLHEGWRGCYYDAWLPI